MRKINVRFLLGLVTIVAVLAGATHLLHGHQVRRSAEVLLVQADNRLKADKPGEAIGYLQRYVKLNPADTAQRARLARALADTGNYRAAFFLLARVVREEPGRLDEGRRLVEVAMRIGRYNDARAHLKDHLIKAHPDDAVLHDLLGQCETGLGSFEKADKAFAHSIQLDPSAVKVYLRHATVLREYREQILQPTSDPEKVLDEMVANNGKDFRAYLARVAYRRQYGLAAGGEDLPSALEQDVQRALELAPDDADVLLQAAQVAREAHDEAGQARAREHLQRGLKLHPEMPGWY
ncbi:MAG: tetratricopeptide repeat protein, partial [Pirellulales bacterium]